MTTDPARSLLDRAIQVAGQKQDIIYLAQHAIRLTNDPKALARLQASLTRWINANTPKEEE